MESIQDKLAAYRALKFQFDEGIDEWILPTPQSRFEEARLAKEAKLAASQQPPAAPSVAQIKPAQPSPALDPATIDFSKFDNDQAIIEALHGALPASLRQTLHDPIEPWGDADAEIAVIIEPPHREVVSAQSFEVDDSLKLLRNSLQAINLDFDASQGQEPRARIQMIPISPWRMPQDRKFLDAEAQLFKNALQARLSLRAPRALLLAGSNLGQLEDDIKDGKLFDRPAIPLVSPSVMLREPMLKRVHWQRLLAFHSQLDGLLTP